MQGKRVNDVCLNTLKVQYRPGAYKRDALVENKGLRDERRATRDNTLTMSGPIQCVFAVAVQPVINKPTGKKIVPGTIEAVRKIKLNLGQENCGATT